MKFIALLLLSRYVTQQLGAPVAPPQQRASAFAAFARATALENVAVVAGVAEKRAGSPLLVQDRPWEPKLDNGYPNILPPVSFYA